MSINSLKVGFFYLILGFDDESRRWGVEQHACCQLNFLFTSIQSHLCKLGDIFRQSFSA
jgi:hypothetical protein